MISLVSALGLTPMVVTEIVDELGKRGVKVDRIVVLTTKDPRVDLSYYALALDVSWSYDGVELIRVELPFEDINSQNDHDTFVDIAKDAMRRELEEGRRVIVSVAGGRKTMGVGLYKAGVELGIEEFYHVIAEPTSSDFFKNLMMYDLKAMFEGKLEVPENLREYIKWEMHRPDVKVTLIRV